MGLPMFVFCTYQYGRSRQLEKSLSTFEEEKSLQKQVSVIVAKKPLDSGHVIEAADIKTVTLILENGGDKADDSVENYVGKRCRLDISEGSILGEYEVYEGEEQADDERVTEIDYAETPTGLKEDDLIDIRIFFPSGEDYVVAAHKRIESLNLDEDGKVSSFEIIADESELLHLAGAYVDRSTYTGCSIYAIKYLDDIQNGAEVDYPVNLSVFTLLSWDPNVVSRVGTKDNVRKREVLESHLPGEEGAVTTEDESQLDEQQLLYLFE